MIPLRITMESCLSTSHRNDLVSTFRAVEGPVLTYVQADLDSPSSP